MLFAWMVVDPHKCTLAILGLRLTYVVGTDLMSVQLLTHCLYMSRMLPLIALPLPFKNLAMAILQAIVLLLSAGMM
jgi:hypothetical protein